MVPDKFLSATLRNECEHYAIPINTCHISHRPFGCICSYDTASAKEVGAAVQSAFADLDDERTTESPEQDLSGGVDGEYANIRGLLAPRRLSARKRTRFGQQPTTKNGTKHAVFRLRGHDLTVTELNVPSIPHSIAKIHGRHITRLDVSGGALCDFGVLVQFKVLQSLVLALPITLHRHATSDVCSCVRWPTEMLLFHLTPFPQFELWNDCL